MSKQAAIVEGKATPHTRWSLLGHCFYVVVSRSAQRAATRPRKRRTPGMRFVFMRKPRAHERIPSKQWFHQVCWKQSVHGCTSYLGRVLHEPQPPFVYPISRRTTISYSKKTGETRRHTHPTLLSGLVRSRRKVLFTTSAGKYWSCIDASMGCCAPFRPQRHARYTPLVNFVLKKKVRCAQLHREKGRNGSHTTAPGYSVYTSSCPRLRRENDHTEFQSSSPSSSVGEMADTEASEKQLSRCEEMVQHSLQRCECIENTHRPSAARSVTAKPAPELLSGVEAHGPHHQRLCGNLRFKKLIILIIRIRADSTRGSVKDVC